jgi:prophage regulatory protein
MRPDADADAAAAGPPRQWPLLLDMKLLPAFTGLSRSALYRLIAAGRFPRAVAVEGVGARWRRGEVEKWCESLKAPARRGKRVAAKAGGGPDAAG